MLHDLRRLLAALRAGTRLRGKHETLGADQRRGRYRGSRPHQANASDKALPAGAECSFAELGQLKQHGATILPPAS